MDLPHRLRLTLETLPKEAVRGNRQPISISYGFVETPLGRCLIGQSEDRVCYLAFAPSPVGSDSAVLNDLAKQWDGASLTQNAEQAQLMMHSIFYSDENTRRDIELLVRGTDFQIEVWKALLNIPYGGLSTYALVAQAVGRPGATRAVGSAIGANAIAWLIPCHRVVRSDGELGGYRWGLAAKRACLDFECGGCE